MMTNTVFTILLIFVYSISAIEYTCDSTLACGCSKTSTVASSRIVGGETASQHAWGWMISVYSSDKFLCGASLISSEYAVTSASCVTHPEVVQSKLSIQAGTNFLNATFSNTVQRRTVMKIFILSQFNSDPLSNNIAIIQFSPLTTTSNSKLAFICLPGLNEDLFRVDDNLVALGWGFTDKYNNKVSNALQQVTLKAYPTMSMSCVRSGLTNSDRQFCAGDVSGQKGELLLGHTSF